MRTLALLLLSSCVAPSPSPQEEGRFVRIVWSKSRRQGDGATMNRVNSPDTATGRFKDRPESKATGTLVLSCPDDPAALSSAELYLELWGGHPGTAKKSFTLNGQGPYEIPEVGAADKNCTYSYPAIPLRLDQLRRGENVFQFTCDKGSTFWGHFLFEIASLRVTLKEPPHPFRARVRAIPNGERLELSLDASAPLAAVTYEGLYHGFDENGDGATRDWHGFTKEGKHQGDLGASWDLSMIPDQEDIEVRAELGLADGLVYVTPSLRGLRTPARPSCVALVLPQDLPRPFWSRASREMKCGLRLDVYPARIERAELHVVIWDGGKGNTPEPFTLNGHALPVAGNGRHDLLYRVVPVDPAWLKQGTNEIRVLSDTEHHGIEVLLPGPALVLRTRD